MSECIEYIRKAVEKEVYPLKTHVNQEVMAVKEETLNKILKKAEKKFARSK